MLVQMAMGELKGSNLWISISRSRNRATPPLTRSCHASMPAAPFDLNTQCHSLTLSTHVVPPQPVFAVAFRACILPSKRLSSARCFGARG